MTALRNCFAFGIVAIAIVAGTFGAKGNGQQSGISSAGPRIDVAALMSRADIASLPIQQVDQPF